MATALGLSLTGPVAAATDVPFISEIHYDNTGTDAGEAVEIEAPVGYDLSGWQLYLYNGNGGATYTPTTTLSGVVPAAGVQSYAISGLQNGAPDGIALVKPDGTVAEFLSYEGVFTASNGPAAGTTSVDIGVSESEATLVGQSLQKIDGVWKAAATSTFGTKNTASTPEEPDPEEPGAGCAATVTHTIAQVQGTGTATPLAGSVVTVEGVVTADHRTGGYNGIYIQTAGSGGDRPVAAGAASDGIFVYLTSTAANHPTVAIGDVVRVTGTVSEYNALTQITIGAKTDVQVCSSGATLPAPVALTLPLSDEARESAEGMLVAPVGTYTVSDVYNTNRYGEVILAAGSVPARIPTDIARPGSDAANAQKAANKAGRILVDDAKTTNLATAGLPPTYITKDEPLRVGDTVEKFSSSVLSYGFSEWRLQPATPVDSATPAISRTTFKASNPRTSAPAEVGGDIKVASFNVLNYFVHFGGEARGAADEAAKEKQEAKIVSAISALDADVVALMEIENSVRFETVETQLALKTLVGELNAVDGAGTWDYVRSPAELPTPAEQDVITSAIIYKPAKATPKGASKSINDETVWGNAREPIAQTFHSGTIDFTVVSNHFKSKSASVTPTGDNVDTGDGQGAYNGDRKRQAASLATFVEGLGTDKVILLGDFNSYGQEDPLQVLYDKGYADAHATHAPDKSSYVFGGESGSLDHALVTGEFAKRITGVDIWNINSVESFAFEYDGYAPFYEDGPFRSSDHDPVVVGLETGLIAPVNLQLLNINDFHGRLESPTTVNGQAVGGAAQLVGLIDQLRAANPNTAWISAGDNIGASTFISAIDKDNPTIDALNAGGLAVSAVGNHEFDQGIADLTGRVSDRANFPLLGANVYTEDGKRVLQAYDVQNVGGVRVGYIGVVTEQTGSLVNPDGIKGIKFHDPIAEVNTLAAQLSDGDEANGEADVLVLLAHEGAASDNITSAETLQADPVFGPFTKVSAEIDAIVSGHTHQPYAFQVPVPGVPGKTRPVVQAEDYGEKLGKIGLTYDPATGEVTSSTSELITVTGYPSNTAVANIVAAAKTNATELGKAELGKISGDILRAYTSTGAENRGAESVLGNFIADAQLDQTKDAGRGGAQIAFMNPGGLRADLKYGTDGTITYSQAFAVQPFSNDVVTRTLKGSAIKAALEEQWQPAGAARPYLHLGVSKGFTYSFDASQPQGSRIIASSIKLNGVTIDPNGDYRVTTNSFLAGGGDNFPSLISKVGVVTTGDNDLTMLVNYFAQNTPITADTVFRATPGVLDGTAPTGTYALNTAAIWTGQTVTLTETALDDDVSDNSKITRVVNWGDGTATETLTAATATHTYAAAGSYQVTVTLTDEAGNSGTVSAPSTVVVSTQTGTFSLSTKSIWVSQSVTLNVAGVASATDLAVNWGDGVTTTTSANNGTVSHAYTKAGRFSVTVTPRNVAGAGKSVTVGTVDVVKDVYKPTVRLTVPWFKAFKSSWKSISGTVVDKGVGVASVKVKLIQERSGKWYYYSAGKWTKATSKSVASAKAAVLVVIPDAKGNWKTAISGVDRGTLQISYWAGDKAGNSSTAAYYAVRITR
ncbi:ExeM/NucH family extracellular endonuclease [Actinoplanes sp. NPDC026670]|uniref:ExeM/NucH family extracellular endonuclease n=1 Tax=Actinoplanes sp. NPDC026670 TaxID=3154700 RepID=UPI0033DE8B60